MFMCFLFIGFLRPLTVIKTLQNKHLNLTCPRLFFDLARFQERKRLEDRNLLKLRSLDSSFPFFLSDNSIRGQ